MGMITDLTDARFGRLVVVELAPRPWKAHRSEWICRCDCGGMRRVQASSLRRGATKSCGCIWAERIQETNVVHGHARADRWTGAYISWRGMKQRCLNPHNPSYPNYGGRGVTVCLRWRESFEAFLADMGDRPAGCSLDRIDPAGDYEPGNCRWATPLEQRHNRRAA